MNIDREDATKMIELLEEMQRSLSVAKTALKKYQKARDEYHTIKRRWSDEEDVVDDEIAEVYSGVIGAKMDV